MSDTLRVARPRANRFRIELPVRLRPLSNTHWVDGRSLDVSSTGLLFQTPAAALSDPVCCGLERLDIRLVLDTRPAGGPLGEFRCVGRVVRMEQQGRAAVVAVAFDECRYHCDEPPGRS